MALFRVDAPSGGSDVPVPVAVLPNCAVCGTSPTPTQWRGMHFCSPACGLAWIEGGDAIKNRTGTRYAKKRRLLRGHRKQMRVMEEFVAEMGSDQEAFLQERIVEETGNTAYWLDIDSDMDEDSDAEDPEATTREELRERGDLIEALTDHTQQEKILKDLERARMANADLEGRLSRSQ